MFRYVLKRRRIKKNLRKIFHFYRHNVGFSVGGYANKCIQRLYNNIHILAQPTRQHYFTFANLKTNKLISFSSGVILKKAGYGVKFFKRSYTSAAPIILFFRHYYLFLFKNIYIYIIKNINYRQLTFFKKLFTLISLDIYYLVHRKSYIPRFNPPRRIKRRVLRLISRQ